MNSYLIQHKIKTLAQIYTSEREFQFQGFRFKNWNYTLAEGATGDAWIAEKTIEADNAQTAVNQFQEELAPVIERISFVSQCYASSVFESFLVYKENADKIVFIWYAEEQKGVPLHFDENETQSLQQLDSFKNQTAFTYLQEATNSITHLGRLTMLIKTIESIAGQTSKTDKCECGKERTRSATNTDVLKQILVDPELFKKIFGSGGVRHKLSHGNEVKLDDNYVEKLYDAVTNYFNSTYGTNIDTNVVSPQRNFHGHYTVGKGWYKVANPVIKIDLKELTELVKKHFHTGHVIKPNGDLEMVDKPKNY